MQDAGMRRVYSVVAIPVDENLILQPEDYLK